MRRSARDLFPLRGRMTMTSNMSTGHRTWRALRRPLGAAIALISLAGPLGAQGAASADSMPARADSALIPDRALFTRSDLYVAGAFAATTLALLPLDRHFAQELRTEALLENRTVSWMADKGRWIGGPGTLVIGASMYAVGRIGRVPKMAELALHGTEAVLVGQVFSGLLKNVAGRTRPYASTDTNSFDFAFGRGLKEAKYKAFPSGHATSAFSAAAAVVAETHEWWPRSTWYVAPVMFGGATMVGLSRMYHDQHWASDIVLGAAIGTFAGLKTVRFNHTRAGHKLDRILLGTRVTPTANGPALGYSLTF